MLSPKHCVRPRMANLAATYAETSGPPSIALDQFFETSGNNGYSMPFFPRIEEAPMYQLLSMCPSSTRAVQIWTSDQLCDHRSPA